jgi:hypothetical protein
MRFGAAKIFVAAPPFREIANASEVLNCKLYFLISSFDHSSILKYVDSSAIF